LEAVGWVIRPIFLVLERDCESLPEHS
jgi:hypothetical protein